MKKHIFKSSILPAIFCVAIMNISKVNAVPGAEMDPITEQLLDFFSTKPMVANLPIANQPSILDHLLEDKKIDKHNKLPGASVSHDPITEQLLDFFSIPKPAPKL